MAKNIAWLGVVLFAVSWFLDVHVRLSRPLSPSAAEESAVALEVRYGGPPGWQAFRSALDLLTDEPLPQAIVKVSDTKRMLLGATALTNGVMAIAALLLFVSLRGVPGWLGFLLLVCAGLNLGWLYHTDAEFRDGLRVGYWLWTGSFLVVAVSTLRASSD